jgi:hypothetical protein
MATQVLEHLACQANPGDIKPFDFNVMCDRVPVGDHHEISFNPRISLLDHEISL